MDLNTAPAHPGMRRVLRDGYRPPNVFADADVMRRCAGYNSSYAHRWLLLGLAGSGSCFHVDPFNTSAWNALLSGRKRWALYPPSGPVPPGMGRWSAQGAAVAGMGKPTSRAGVSDRGREIGEALFDRRLSSDRDWGLTSRFHFGGFAAGGGDGALAWFRDVLPALGEAERPLECTVAPGDIVLIPAGWWHAVLNLETSLAVTENFATATDFERRMRQTPTRGCVLGMHRMSIGWYPYHERPKDCPEQASNLLPGSLGPPKRFPTSHVQMMLAPYTDRCEVARLYHVFVADDEMREP